MAVAEVREVPESVSCFKLNEDGSYESVAPVNIDVYIDESQVYKIWNPDILQFIRRVYGEIVCVMHTHSINTRPPVYQTQKFILGG